MDSRLEAFLPEEKPVDLGPAVSHRLHGAIPIAADCQLRITSQPRRQCGDRFEGARLLCRKWYLRRDSGTWWPSKREAGIFVLARDARAFLAAVTAAVAALEQDGGPT